jgi:hypothetical protein
MKKWG